MATGLWPAATISDCVRRAPLRRRRQVHLPRAGRRTTRRRLSAPQQLRRRQRRERPCRLRWRDIRPIGGGVDGRGGARGGDASGLSAASGLGGHAHWSRKVCVWFFGVSCISLSEQPEPAPRRFVRARLLASSASSATGATLAVGRHLVTAAAASIGSVVVNVLVAADGAAALGAGFRRCCRDGSG